MENSKNKSGHIAVIDCAVRDLALDPFNQMAKTFGQTLTYHAPAFFGMDTLLNDSKAKGYIILGSASSVNDRLDWQVQLEEFILKRLEEGTPVLGICFGHQLVARAFGALVGHATKDGKGFEGARKVTINKQGLNFGLESSYDVVVLHKEEVKNLPEGFETLGSSPECALDIIRHRELPYLGLQGHPEANPAFVKTEFKNQGKLGSLSGAFGSGRSFLQAIFEILFKS